jgi:hypothetical protein
MVSFQIRSDKINFLLHPAQLMQYSTNIPYQEAHKNNPNIELRSLVPAP